MYRVIALLAVFLVIYYVIVFIKLRKKKRLADKSFVEEYHRRYRRLPKKEKAHDTDSLFDMVDSESVRTDYVDKEDFLNEVRTKAQVKDSRGEEIKVKHFKF